VSKSGGFRPNGSPLRSNFSGTVEDKGIQPAYENIYRKCPFSRCWLCSGCVGGFSATAELLVTILTITGNTTVINIVAAALIEVH